MKLNFLFLLLCQFIVPGNKVFFKLVVKILNRAKIEKEICHYRDNE